MKGIDISSWQNGISADAINSQDFAIFKLSEGRTWSDPCFNSFYEVAKIPVGAYVFSYATTEADARAEARNALSLINGRPLPLGIFMDVEDTKQLALRDSELTAVVKAFCDEIKAAGYKSGAYGSDLGLWAKVGASYLGEDVLVWSAQWSGKPHITCDVWQTGDSGTVTGYNGNVDTDEAVSDRFKALVSGHYDPAPAPEPVSDQISGEKPTLKLGDNNDEVKLMQTLLILRGFDCGIYFGSKWKGADGIFGAKTRSALTSFQQSRGLPVTDCDNATWKELIFGG